MMEFETRHFRVGFKEDAGFQVGFTKDDAFKVDFGAGVAEEYTGRYNVTPTRETQTLSTANRVLLDNVTIEPIPSNYGLITWNGSVLTVS